MDKLAILHMLGAFYNAAITDVKEQATSGQPAPLTPSIGGEIFFCLCFRGLQASQKAWQKNF